MHKHSGKSGFEKNEHHVPKGTNSGKNGSRGIGKMGHGPFSMQRASLGGKDKCVYFFHVNFLTGGPVFSPTAFFIPKPTP
jgi:hypothetical protein